MTNPGNAVGTNGGYGGRTSVNAFNDVLSAFNGRGIVKGWACIPKSGMTVSLGGQDLVRDVAIVENDIGQYTTLDNISTQPVDITLSDAPTLGARIDLIVGYVTNPPDSNGELIDNPDACGIITVESSVTTNPIAPDEAMIREAITADGGSGVNAYYVVLAQVQVGTGMTTITNTEIMQGAKAKIAVDGAYPVGSIYTSTTLSTASAVADALGGGTWVAFGAGRTLIGVDSSDNDFKVPNAMGGEKTHTLTIDEMPEHRHPTIPYSNSSGTLSARHTTAWNKTDTAVGETGIAGNSQPHNNLQPYITVYRWLRTA